jgi:hypothetical protein
MVKTTTEDPRWSRALGRLGLIVIVATSPLLMGANGCMDLTQPTTLDDPESFCSAAGTYWCNTNIVPQSLTAQGGNGFCMAGNTAATTTNYNRGYSGVTGTGGATPVYPSTAQAWEACGSSGATDRGVCNTVVTCTKH